MEDVVRHPVISPNGRMLAWGNVSEGQKKTGTIWLSPFTNPTKYRTITSLGVIPRFWVDEVSKDTLLQFASHASPNSDSLDWIQGNTQYYRLCGDTTCLSRQGYGYLKEAFIVVLVPMGNGPLQLIKNCA